MQRNSRTVSSSACVNTFYSDVLMGSVDVRLLDKAPGICKYILVDSRVTFDKRQVDIVAEAKVEGERITVSVFGGLDSFSRNGIRIEFKQCLRKLEALKVTHPTTSGDD